jgi:hypothetical protein
LRLFNFWGLWIAEKTSWGLIWSVVAIIEHTAVVIEWWRLQVTEKVTRGLVWCIIEQTAVISWWYLLIINFVIPKFSQ